MQPSAFLCNWTGTKRVFEFHRHRTLPQDIGVVDKDASLVRASKPGAPDNTTGTAFRTPNTLTGTFASGM
jgi:hypothetical protein